MVCSTICSYFLYLHVIKSRFFTKKLYAHLPPSHGHPPLHTLHWSAAAAAAAAAAATPVHFL